MPGLLGTMRPHCDELELRAQIYKRYTKTHCYFLLQLRYLLLGPAFARSRMYLTSSVS